MKQLPRLLKGAQPQFQPIAKAIRAAMDQRGMDVPMLTEAMGMTKGQRGAVAHWVVGKNAPGMVLRPKLAKVLGLTEDQITLKVDIRGRRRNGAGRMPNLGPAQRAVALVEVAKVNGEIMPASPPVSDVFTIRARSDGTMVVKLDASLPFAKGAQLVQFLIGFGLVIGADAEVERG